MADLTDHARAQFAQSFQPLGDAGYTLERVADAAAYWQLHDRELGGDFPPEVFFDLHATRTAEARAGLAGLEADRAARTLTDFTVVRAGDEIVAMFSGEQRDRGLYRMWHTNVRRSHRRRGLYRQILAATVAYTRALGFDAITSEHAPSNNPVIIAKLQAGFCIYGLEVDPMAGLSVILRYFHQPEARAAYEFRCGLATVTPALRAAGFGAFATLRDQLSG
ncbi:MAG: GNAT family N-acetyltransferase [Myxococcales bacterium]|nr:GNAT family N-acetyltransferase [Myxococcales bacterium]